MSHVWLQVKKEGGGEENKRLHNFADFFLKTNAGIRYIILNRMLKKKTKNNKELNILGRRAICNFQVD